jgi:hypothetical protein
MNKQKTIIGALVLLMALSGHLPAQSSGGNRGGGGVSNAPATTFPSAVTSLNAYGDSITAGFGLGVTQQNWAQQFSTAVGAGVLANNFAVSGARLYQPGFFPGVLGITPSASVGNVIGGLSNELTDAASFSTTIANGLEDMTLYLALPNSLKQQVINSAISFSAGWTVGSAFGQSNNIEFSDNTAGRTATATVSGTAVYVCGYVFNTGYGSGTVTVDGVSQGSISFNSTVAGGTNIYPQCYRFTGF